MKLLDRLPKRTKRTAAVAAGGFALSNPLMTAFIAGIGLAVWYTYRRRQTGGY